MQPFRVQVAQGEIDDLKHRISATRRPSEPSGVGWDRGVPLDHLRALADYWLRDYDWRAAEAELNRFPQYTTEIDGATVHFLHVRSARPDATPVLLVHGWPGSVVEFLDVTGPLTDPVAHGGDAADAYHLVIPSLPGYGFSGPLAEPGWGAARIAKAFAELMDRLGCSASRSTRTTPFRPIRAWARSGYPNIVQWTEQPSGGHFAALEKPELFVADLREFGRKITG